MTSGNPKTVLLIFIHGFKGDDTTFARFPTGISHALSKLLNAHESSTVTEYEGDAQYNVLPIVYPAFETRGSLQATVERFRAWLLEKVIDAEVARGTESPTVEPGVGVVIVGHSMVSIFIGFPFFRPIHYISLERPWQALSIELPNNKEKAGAY